MMQKGRVDRSIKVRVLEMLKPQISDAWATHGDIKDCLVFDYAEIGRDFRNQRNSRIIF